jgi:hypothetical protein
MTQRAQYLGSPIADGISNRGARVAQTPVERVRARLGDSPSDVLQSIARAAEDEDAESLERIAHELESLLDETHDGVQHGEALADAVERGADPGEVDALIARIYDDLPEALDLSGVEELLEAR